MVIERSENTKVTKLSMSCFIYAEGQTSSKHTGASAGFVTQKLVPAQSFRCVTITDYGTGTQLHTCDLFHCHG